MFTEREKIIIENLIDDFISTGKPISSERILCLTNLNCSTATIRKDLNNLESRGLIESEHVSSGRVPTVLGYRYYIDNSLVRKPFPRRNKQLLKILLVQI